MLQAVYERGLLPKPLQMLDMTFYFFLTVISLSIWKKNDSISLLILFNILWLFVRISIFHICYTSIDFHWLIFPSYVYPFFLWINWSSFSLLTEPFIFCFIFIKCAVKNMFLKHMYIQFIYLYNKSNLFIFPFMLSVFWVTLLKNLSPRTKD